MRRATSGAPPVCTTAGPHTASTLPPSAWAARIRSATCCTTSALGFSELTSLFMNSNTEAPRCLDGRVDAHAAVADHDLVAGPHPVHRDRAHAGRRRRRGRSPSPGSRPPPTRRRSARRWRGWWWSRSRPGAHRRGRRRRAWRSPEVTRLAPWTWSDSMSRSSSAWSPSSSMRAAARIGVGAPDLDVGQVVGDARPRRWCRGPWRGAASRRCGRSARWSRWPYPMGSMPPPMGQPITVVEKTSAANPAILRLETNRPLSGMGHERYDGPPERAAPATGRRAGPPALRGRRRGERPHQRLRRHRHPRRRAHRARAWATSSASCSSTTATHPRAERRASRPGGRPATFLDIDMDRVRGAIMRGAAVPIA